MAGLGYKDFTAGAVLTAAQVDGYLMEQAVMNFAGTAARNSALSSVQSAGMMAHVGGGTVTVYDGSAWQQVYPAEAAFTFVAGTAFSAVASVSVNDCFTSNYDNYRILLEISAAVSATQTRLRLRVSGADNSSLNYYQNGAAQGSSSSTTVTDYRSAGLSTNWTVNSYHSGSAFSSIDIYAPAKTVTTEFTAMTIQPNATDMLWAAFGGRMSVTTAYDSLSFLANTGTITGNVRIYGYRNA